MGIYTGNGVLPAYAGMILWDASWLEMPVEAAAVLPAYAGMIPIADAGPVRVEGAPRVCGDDPSCQI